MIMTVMITQAYAQETKDDINASIITTDNIRFSLTTDKKTYDDGEPVKISWKVTNIGSGDVSFTKRSSCDNGLDFKIFDSELHNLGGLLTETALLIPKNDPSLSKFDNKQFYGDILHAIKTEPTKQINIQMLTSDKDELEKILKEKFEISKVSKTSTFSFVVAKVEAKDIPQIAKLDLVRRILGGGGKLCSSAITTAVLHPNQSIEDSFSWGQIIQSPNRAENPIRVPNGFYSIDVKFNNIPNCVIIGLRGGEPLSTPPNPPCGLLGMPSGTSKDEIIKIYSELLSINPELKGIYGDVLESIRVYQPADISPAIINNAQKEVSISYQITIRNMDGVIVGGSQIVSEVLEPGQKWDPPFRWSPQEAGTYSVEIMIGNGTENLFSAKSFDIVVQEQEQVQVIPIWIKQNAEWWASNQTKDSEFIDAIQYLIEKDIIVAGNASSSEIIDETSQKIPTWIRKNAEWWVNDLISDDDFMKGIEYLLKVRVIRITDS